VCLQVSEKSGVMKKTVDHRLGRSSSCFFYSHFIISLKRYDMVGMLAEFWATQKDEAYSRDFFSANIIQQVVDF
jgi:hypothetical protein